MNAAADAAARSPHPRRRLSLWLTVIALAAGLIGAYLMASHHLPANLGEKTTPDRLSMDGGHQRIDLIETLLAACYQGFAASDEQLAYAALAQAAVPSLAGTLYVQARRQRLLAGQGTGIALERVIVREATLIRAGSRPRLRATWTVRGVVSHFGHAHVRDNRHVALIDLAWVNGNWKIAALSAQESQQERSPLEGHAQ
jgi:hypothetical protein